MVNEKMNEIHLFAEGVASVCDDAKIIVEKALAFFGEKDKRNVDFVLSLKTQAFSAKQFAKILNQRDFSEGQTKAETECAKRNGLVIVYGHSDDHLECEKGKRHLLRGVGKMNNISARWCDQDAITDDWEPILWSYKTDIPHECFIAFYDGILFCEGFVFDMKELKI
ncbi:hypothetical protein [Fibrobacter sp. UWB13]|uniref:hypothetical protein n=1 Tax=Fibrobacter sp. UWB13 TaxID=1896204 RepID=UPI000A0C287F|nr:hypothetical protein [Fibrobacter sp. UWB13]SMG34364.1 hypothetical protein SAMN05720489_2375 [Fibrobacter sp. UWB13]